MTLPLALDAAPLAAVQPVSNPAPGANLTDAFQSALRSAGEALYANPDAVGRTLMDGADGFRLRENQMRAVVKNVGAADGATPAAGSPLANPAHSASVSSVSAPDAAEGPGAPGGIDAMKAASAQTMGVMMETFSFALQASLVNNAATSFTSSVNTLIKTQ